MRDNLLPDDILKHVGTIYGMSEYSMEHLEQDLNQLVKWKNIVANHDVRNPKTIEEFKRKTFRYQITSYSVKIERMLSDLIEKGEEFQGSLNQRTFEKYLIAIRAFLMQSADQDIIEKWEDVVQCFTSLRQDTADYLAYMNSKDSQEIMNQVLKQQNNYRGLKFEILWKPKAGQSDEEMSTADLVSLLRKPAQTITDDDRERMILHFRTKINSAKVIMERDESMQTLHDMMKSILDYRKWFSFVLYYVKDEEPRKELTNSRFNKLSGGERAMAMYLPLFTAITARYQSAREDAPAIIALDEAFAGVDETNIAELFKAIDDLGFDYILNSQALWGDYDTVNSLNIYNLIREKGSDYVAHIKYHWNGKERTIDHES